MSMEREKHYPDTIDFTLFEKLTIVNDIKEIVYWYPKWSFGLQQIVDGDLCYLYPISEVVMMAVMIDEDYVPRIDHVIRMTYMDSITKERVRPICIPIGYGQEERDDFLELYEDLCNKFLDTYVPEEIRKHTKELIWMLLCNHYHLNVCDDEEIREIEGKRIPHKD